MNNFFASLEQPKDIVTTTDSLGGRSLFDSDIYEATVSVAYTSVSKSGAKAVNLILNMGKDKQYRETIYVSSNTAKGGKSYTERDGKTYPMIGFTLINDLCIVATGLPLTSQDLEEKLINIYDFEARKEVPRSTDCLVNLHGKKVKVALIKALVNKQEKNSAGEYVDIAETKETNAIVKFLNEDSFTANELEAKDRVPVYAPKWLTLNQGITKDKSKEVAKSSVPTASSSPIFVKPLFFKK